MGYDIHIGEAVIDDDRECIYRDADGGALRERYELKLTVEPLELPEAPAFPGDKAQHVNYRSPSYTQWADFAQAAGLQDWFFNEDHGVMHEHSGIFPLVEDDWHTVHAAVERRQRQSGKEPGWNPVPHPAMRGGEIIAQGSGTVMVMMGEPTQVDGDLDPVLARLLWLEWWIRWALDHCQRPAIYNL